MRSEAAAAGACVVVALFFAAKAVQGYDGFATLRPVGLAAAGLLVAAGLIWLGLRISGRAGRVAIGHGHGAKVIAHESGHLAAADHIGAKVKSYKVGGGEGVVRLADPESLSSRDYMAFMLAGRYAASTGAGCSGDDANFRAEERRMRSAGMRPGEINRVAAQARADAKRYGRSSRAKHWERKLKGGSA